MTTHACTCQTAPLSPETLTKVDAIIARHKDQPGALMPVLQEVQEAVGYLPPQVQERIALGLNIQGSEVFGVMSFYSMYTWKPKGKYVVRMCESPPCHVNGAENMFHALQQELGIGVGETTADGLFTLELTACLGVCEVAPAMQINEVVVGHLTPAKIKQVLNDYRAGKAVDFQHLRYSTNDFRVYKQSPHDLILLDNVGVIDPTQVEDYVAKGGYATLKKVLTSLTPEQVVEEVKTSGLRGRGGAGFPTGLKWSFTRPLQVAQKYVICNADEGEPGTIKDRYLMEGDPHKVLEGMAIAGFAVGASQGLHLRPGRILPLQAKAQPGHRPGPGPRLLGREALRHRLLLRHRGALRLRLLHLRRGNRAHRIHRRQAWLPPHEAALPGRGRPLAQPTIVNNVESLASVPAILAKGGAWYKSLGTPDTTGTKIYQIIGHVKTPQIVEVPAGLTLRELIDTYGGGLKNGSKFKMCQTGGASAGLVTVAALDTPIDYGSMAKVGGALGSGTMLVMDESVCAVDFIRSVAVFFRHESCGQCTPCREGTPRILETMTRITRGQGKMEDLDFLERLAGVMIDASFCPLGQTAGSPMLSAFKNFRPEFEEHILEKKCRAGVCKLG